MTATSELDMPNVAVIHCIFLNTSASFESRFKSMLSKQEMDMNFAITRSFQE